MAIAAVTEPSHLRSIGVNADQCPVREGYRYSRYRIGIPFRTVDAVGGYIRAGGGYVVPVQFRSGQCALLRWIKGDGHTSVDRVYEERSNNEGCNHLLKRSVTVPQIVHDGDVSAITLRVTDRDKEMYDPTYFPTGECEYELVFKGVLGNKGRIDEVRHFYSSSMDDE